MDFVEKYTTGFDRLAEHVKRYGLEYAARTCAIEKKDILRAALMIGSIRPMTLVCGYGIQRYINGGQTVRSISMIPALTGDIGIKGGGFRFANKQWKLDWPFVPGDEAIIRDNYSSASLARAIKEYANPEIKMLWIERANPLTMNPDINSLRCAMDGLDFVVTVDQFMTDTADYSDIVLPAQSFFEYTDIFKGYWTPYISLCSKAIEPLGESKNESQIYRMLGEKMGMDMDYLPEYSKDTIDKILKVCGIDTNVKSLREAPYDGNRSEIAFSERKFNTPTGRIELYCESMNSKWNQSPLPEFNEKVAGGEFTLRLLSTHTGERIHSQFAGIKRLEKETPYVYMNSKDASKRKIEDGDIVCVYNRRGNIHVEAKITDSIKEGSLNIYEGLSHRTGVNVNVLTSQDESDIANGATYYDCFVEVVKCRQ